MRRAFATLFILNIETVAGSRSPASFRRPTWMERSWLREISLTISTSFCWTSWKEGNGLPELLPLLGVGQRRLVAIGSLPEPVPPHAVTGMREDRKGRTKTVGLRQPGALGHVAVPKRDVRLPGGTLGALAG